MTRVYPCPINQIARQIALSGFVLLLAMALLTLNAHAGVITTPLVGLDASGPILYSPDNNVFGGSGTGTLTNSVGTLPVGTAVDWYLMGGFYPNGATLLTNNYVQQTFISMIDMSITVASDGSDVLSGWAAPLGGYAFGQLGSSSALIVLQFGQTTSSYFAPPMSSTVLLTGTTNAPLSLDQNCIWCPSFSAFDLDWSFSMVNASTPEPSSLLLAGGGLLVIAWRRRKSN